jgi:hypothetical protein
MINLNGFGVSALATVRSRSKDKKDAFKYNTINKKYDAGASQVIDLSPKNSIDERKSC